MVKYVSNYEKFGVVIFIDRFKVLKFWVYLKLFFTSNLILVGMFYIIVLK